MRKKAIRPLEWLETKGERDTHKLCLPSERDEKISAMQTLDVKKNKITPSKQLTRGTTVRIRTPARSVPRHTGLISKLLRQHEVSAKPTFTSSQAIPIQFHLQLLRRRREGRKLVQYNRRVCTALMFGFILLCELLDLCSDALSRKVLVGT